jgi:hypothetical protein
MEGSCNLETLVLKLLACAVQYLYYIRYTIHIVPHIHKGSAHQETREGWPLVLLKLRHLGAHRVQMKGVLPWLVCWACRADTRDFLCLGCSSRPAVQNMFFPTRIIFAPIARQAGQAAVLGRLSLRECL